jgi:hypothetical protein
MNATLNPDFTFWTVRWGDELDVYADRSEAEHRVSFITDYEKTHKRVPFSVIECNAGENRIADVTWDFLPEDHDDEAEFREYRAHKAWERDVTPRRL